MASPSISDKKSDDYVVKVADGPPARNSGLFTATPNSPLRAAGPGAAAAPANNFMGALQNSGGASVLAYCLSSISMTLVNKYVVSGRQWNLHLLYLAIQSIVGTTTILLCKNLGMIKDLDPFDPKRAQRWFPISLLLVGMIFTGNKALQFLSVPVYTIFKNLTIIVIAYGEVLWFGGSVSPLTLVSFGLMVGSSVLAAWADFHHVSVSAPASLHDASSVTAATTLSAGYAWMGLNVMCSAMYVLSMRKAIKITNLKNWDVMFYNNLLTVPVLILSSLLIEDWSVANLHSNFPPASRQSLVVGMIYSGLAAIFISYCTAWCIRATSSTTYAMAGALNKLPMAVAGLVFFADPVTFGSVSAILLGFISGLIYTWAKNRKSQPPGLPTSIGRNSGSGAISPSDKGPMARA